MTTITYRRWTAEQALDHADDLKTVYATVFAEPPYNEGPQMPDKFVGWLTEETRHPGFDLVTAEETDGLIGFAYGYTIAAGHWLPRTDQPAPPDLKAAPKFAVMEWAVLPEHRHHGIGRTLMDTLLHQRPERWAILTVNPEADAHRIYTQTGWTHVASTKPTTNQPSMHVMILDGGTRVPPQHHDSSTSSLRNAGDH